MTDAKRILVVEDERPLARALQLKLEKEGMSVTVASDGEEGLSYLEKEEYDLVLLDLIMPKMDGFSVLNALREKGIKARVVVLSNLGQQEDIDKAKELGAEDFFVKSDMPIADVVKYINEK